MEITEKDLENAFSKIDIPKTIRLFMITKNMYVRVYHGQISWKLLSEDFEFIKKMRCERGEILDIFSKMEFMINELIQLNLLGANSKEADKLDEVLIQIDLFSRLKLLKKWKILNNKTVEKINQTKQVRNSFAHAWGVEDVKYKNKPIKENFEEFKKDMLEIWEDLERIYSIEQKKYDINEIFKLMRKEDK